MIDSQVVDVVRCRTCCQLIRRTVRMVKRDTRHHAGSCAAAATRETLWRKGTLHGHMKRMRDAATRTRLRRLATRLARVAPDVSVDRAVAIYRAGYRAGLTAKRRRAHV